VQFLGELLLLPACRRPGGVVVGERRARLLPVHELHLGLLLEERLGLLRRRGPGLRHGRGRGRRRAVRRRRGVRGWPGRRRRRAEHEVLLLFAAGARDGGEHRVGRGLEVGRAGGVGGAVLAQAGRDPGRRLADARRIGRAVELREAVTVQVPVVAQEIGGERDAEDAGVVEGADRLRLVGLVGGGFALDSYLQACSAPREQNFSVRGHTKGRKS
jgi:hypothetical protein